MIIAGQEAEPVQLDRIREDYRVTAIHHLRGCAEVATDIGALLETGHGADGASIDALATAFDTHRQGAGSALIGLGAIMSCEGAA